MPHEKLVGVLHVTYQWKLITWEVSGGRSDEYQRLWSDVPASEVFEMWALMRTNGYIGG